LLKPRPAGVIRRGEGRGADRDEASEGIAALYRIDAGVNGKDSGARGLHRGIHTNSHGL
jgi:hypothetical protein